MTSWTDDEIGGTVWSDQHGVGVEVSPFATTLLDDVDAATARATLDAASASALAASSGSSLVGFIQSGTGALSTTVQDELRRVLYVDQFGAIGNGMTDDSSAIQKAVDSIAAYGSTHNAFSITPSKVLKFTPGKTYVISSEIDATFRNYLTIDFTGSILKWTGANDGRMFDFMGCNFLRVIGDLVNGNSKLGTFFRVSGGNSAGTGGKNNATGGRFKDFVLKSMYASGTVPFIQTTNDTPTYGDNSLDDSSFENVWFSSTGYAGVELASSEISFDRCYWVSVTKGIIYRTGTSAKLVQCVRSGVRYPHFVVQDASIGEIAETNCYAESLNSSGPVEGSLLSCETGGTSTAVKSFGIRGGTYSQGSASDVTTSSKFISCGDARASVYIEGARWQSSVNGALDLGTNGRGFIKKSTLSSSFSDYMPSLIGAWVWERIGRSGQYQLSVPHVETVTLTVDSGGSDDYGALTFTTVEKAFAVMDQLGATQTIIDVKSSLSLTARKFLSGCLRITSSNSSTLTFAEEIRVRAGGDLTIDNITVAVSAARGIINRGGTVFVNTLTVANTSGKYLIRHERGLTICNGFTLSTGSLIDASSGSAGGLVLINGNNTYTSTEVVVLKSDSNVEVQIASTAAPGTGNWEVGIKTVDPSPASGGNLGSICTTAGTPGTWKTYGAVA